MLKGMRPFFFLCLYWTHLFLAHVDQEVAHCFFYTSSMPNFVLSALYKLYFTELKSSLSN